MPIGHHVFISYVRDDRAFVKRLSKDLSAEFAVDVQQIEAGEDWQEKNRASITSAAACLFVCSKASVAGEQSLLSVVLPFALKKVRDLHPSIRFIFPIILDDEGEAGAYKQLRRFHFIDFRVYDQGLKELVEPLRTEVRSYQMLDDAWDAAATKGDHIYISYEAQDRDFVARLSNDLRAVGFHPWVDFQQVKAGEDWQEQIGAAISSAGVYLFVWSTVSIAPESHVRAELDYVEFHKPFRFPFIFPIVIDREGEAGMAGQAPFVDFRVYDEGLTQLVEALRITIGPRQSQSQPLPAQQQQTKGYVFISYAEEDADFVATLKVFLKEKAYAYWEYSESDRNYGTILATDLEAAITDAAAMVCVLSPAWKNSKWALKEYSFADDIGKPVFLLKAKQVEPSLAIAGIPFIDFVQSDKKGFEKLSRELEKKGL